MERLKSELEQGESNYWSIKQLNIIKDWPQERGQHENIIKTINAKMTWPHKSWEQEQ